MWPPAYLARWRVADASGSASAGPALTTVKSVAARTALTIRCIVIGYVVVQVAIWHLFYTADPWRLAGPAIGVAWAAAIVVYLRRSWPGWQVACLDSAVHVALAIGLMWSVPIAMRGDTSNWLFILMAGQIVIPAWFAPTRVLVPLALLSGVAYWAGTVMLPGPVPNSNSPVAAGYLLITVAAVAWCAAWSLYRWATAADAALALADRDSREHYVVLSRDIERREHERLLHDTVLNTLTALARSGGGGSAGVVGRCRHDVTLMEYVLSIPAEADMPSAAGRASAAGQARAAGEAGLASGPDPEENARRSYGGMVAAVEAVASEMRDRGLTVHVETIGGVAAGPAGLGGAAAAGPPDRAGRIVSAGAAAGPDGLVSASAAAGPSAPAGTGSTVGAGPARVPAVPVPVAVAIAFAVREALANVASHAGTDEAWVEICPVAPDGNDSVPAGAGLVAGAPETCPEGIRVTVRDAGAGFDPGQVDPSRLGLRRSIVERLADWGGRALIRSSPGAGTEVILCWAPPQDTSHAAGPGGGAALAGV
jgi:hypothetical protein